MDTIWVRSLSRWCGILIIITMVGTCWAEEPAALSGAWTAETQWVLVHDRAAYALAFSPDSERVITAAADLTLRLWDLSNGRELNRFTGDKASHFVRDIAWSPKSRYALIGAGQYKGCERLTLWDVDKWQETRLFEGHEDPVTQVAFSPDGRRAVSGTIGGDVYAWDVQTGKQISHYKPKVGRTLRTDKREPDGGAKSLNISPDGRHGLWAGGYANYQLRLFDIKTGRELRAFEPAERSREHVVDAVFTRDGRRILAVQSHGFLHVWDVKRATSSRPLRISPTVLASVAFSRDKRIALVGSAGGGLALWRIDGVQQDNPHVQRLLVLQEPHPREQTVNERRQAVAGINQVALSPDLRYAAAADHDRTVRVWRLRPDG